MNRVAWSVAVWMVGLALSARGGWVCDGVRPLGGVELDPVWGAVSNVVTMSAAAGQAHSVETGNAHGLTGEDLAGLGALTDATAFATAEQGALADGAVQANSAEYGQVINDAAAGATAYGWGDHASMGYFGGSLSVTGDRQAQGLKAVFAAGDTQNFGDVCHLGANGQVFLANAGAISTALAIGLCADVSIAPSNAGNILLMGLVRDDAWAWVPGGLVYLSTEGTTGNTLVQTPPIGDDCIVVLGVALASNLLYFNPQLVIVELN